MTKKEAYPQFKMKFECIEECHKCCSGSPGIILVTETEIENISKFLNISIVEFKKTYTRTINNYYSINFGFIDRAYSLKEKSGNDCIFLVDGKCSIYPVRSLQCKAYPFWPSIVSSRSSWEAEKAFCPGINRGKIYTQTEVEKILESLKNQDYSISDK